MESNYTIDKIKKAALVISNDYTYQLLDSDNDIEVAVPYNIYNINCFYDWKDPMEFLNVLTNYSTQKSLDLTLDNAGKDRVSINHKGNTIAYYNISRRHIEIESDLTYDVLDMTYRNRINNFNVLKYILGVLKLSNFIETVKSYKHEEFEIISLERSQHRWIPGFKSLRAPKNRYTLTARDKTVDTYFTADLKYEDKTIKFNNFLESEKEIYTNGTEPLTVEEIDQFIEFYTGLKNRIDPIEIYLEQLQKTL